MLPGFCVRSASRPPSMTFSSLIEKGGVMNIGLKNGRSLLYCLFKDLLCSYMLE
jgi:hypothetical protein